MNKIVVLAGADTDMLRKYVELDEQDEARAEAFERDIQDAFGLISRHPLIGFGHLVPPYRKWSLRGWNMAISTNRPEIVASSIPSWTCARIPRASGRF